MKIKGYKKFQHFKDRRPPWIKLYRDLLDDPEWFAVSGADAKILVMLWLVASEDETGDGQLPCLDKLAFRFRISKDKLSQSIQRLTHWVEGDDIAMISRRYRDDAPELETELETETETETETDVREFVMFWNAYPRKIGKGAARQSWTKLNGKRPAISLLIEAVTRQKASVQWMKDGGQYIPNPSTWLNQHRWEDETDTEILTTVEKCLDAECGERAARGSKYCQAHKDRYAKIRELKGATA